MTKEQLNKHIWEGWTVQDFINDLEPTLNTIQLGTSWRNPIQTKIELEEWCKDSQPHYKKHIPEVVKYFSKKYNIK
jgi:hypothetical protein